MANIVVKILFAPSRNENYVVAVFYAGHDRCYRRLKLPSYSVARYRLAVLFANGKSRFTDFSLASAVKHYKIPVRNARGVLVHVVVLIVLF